MSEQEALDVLEFLDAEDGDEEFTDEDVARILEGKREIERGEFVTLEELRAELQI